MMYGLPCGTEQSSIHRFGLMQGKGVQLTGKREYYMILGAGQPNQREKEYIKLGFNKELEK